MLTMLLWAALPTAAPRSSRRDATRSINPSGGVHPALLELGVGGDAHFVAKEAVTRPCLSWRASVGAMCTLPTATPVALHGTRRTRTPWDSTGQGGAVRVRDRSTVMGWMGVHERPHKANALRQQQ